MHLTSGEIGQSEYNNQEAVENPDEVVKFEGFISLRSEPKYHNVLMTWLYALEFPLPNPSSQSHTQNVIVCENRSPNI